MRHRFLCSNLLIAAVLAVVAVDVRAAEEVNVYSNRPAELLQPLLDGFTKQTGIATTCFSSTRASSSACGPRENIRRPTSSSPSTTAD